MSFEILANKGMDYFAYAKHLQIRGMKDVLRECVPVIAVLKSEGKSFDEFIKWLTKSEHLPDRLDPFTEKLKEIWEGTR
jgi:hypothetical protein